eukprot:s9_g5.t1
MAAAQQVEPGWQSEGWWVSPSAQSTHEWSHWNNSWGEWQSQGTWGTWWGEVDWSASTSSSSSTTSSTSTTTSAPQDAPPNHGLFPVVTTIDPETHGRMALTNGERATLEEYGVSRRFVQQVEDLLRSLDEQETLRSGPESRWALECFVRRAGEGADANQAILQVLRRRLVPRGLLPVTRVPRDEHRKWSMFSWMRQHARLILDCYEQHLRTPLQPSIEPVGDASSGEAERNIEQDLPLAPTELRGIWREPGEHEDAEGGLATDPQAYSGGLGTDPQASSSGAVETSTTTTTGCLLWPPTTAFSPSALPVETSSISSLTIAENMQRPAPAEQDEPMVYAAFSSSSSTPSSTSTLECLQCPAPSADEELMVFASPSSSSSMPLPTSTTRTLPSTTSAPESEQDDLPPGGVISLVQFSVTRALVAWVRRSLLGTLIELFPFLGDYLYNVLDKLFTYLRDSLHGYQYDVVRDVVNHELVLAGEGDVQEVQRRLLDHMHRLQHPQRLTQVALEESLRWLVVPSSSMPLNAGIHERRIWRTIVQEAEFGNRPSESGGANWLDSPAVLLQPDLPETMEQARRALPGTVDGILRGYRRRAWRTHMARVFEEQDNGVVPDPEVTVDAGELYLVQAEPAQSVRNWPVREPRPLCHRDRLRGPVRRRGHVLRPDPREHTDPPPRRAAAGDRRSEHAEAVNVRWVEHERSRSCVPAALSAGLVFLGVFMFATVRPLKWKDQHERRRTAFMRQLRSWTRSCCLEQVLGGRFVLLVAFVLLDATRPLLGSWAQQGDNSVRAFQSGSFMLAQTSVSFLVAIAIAWPLQGSLRAAVKLCFRPNAFFRQLPCAICFTVSKLALLMALARLDAGTVRVMAQLGLPMVAIGSKWFMRKHYTREQWQAIWMIVIGVVTFYLVKTETEHHAADYALHRPWPPREMDEAEPAHTEQPSFLVLTSWELQVSVFYVIVSLASNCLGALISERFLKDHDQGPYYAMKAHLLGGECIVNFTMCLGSWLLASHHTSFVSHLRAGWDHRTVVTMLVWIPSGWCATLVVRRCCALTKNIAQSAGSMLTYVFSIRPVTLIEPALDSQPVKMPVVLLALVSMHSVILFVVASEEQKSQEKQRMEGGDDSLAIEHHELSDSERGAASFVQHYTMLKPPAGAKGRISRISTTAADLYDLANPQDAQESPKIPSPHMANKAH